MEFHTEPKTGIICPLCGEKATYKKIGDLAMNQVNAWICTECPFVGFEYYSNKDIEKLAEYLN